MSPSELSPTPVRAAADQPADTDDRQAGTVSTVSLVRADFSGSPVADPPAPVPLALTAVSVMPAPAPPPAAVTETAVASSTAPVVVPAAQAAVASLPEATRVPPAAGPGEAERPPTARDWAAHGERWLRRLLVVGTIAAIVIGVIARFATPSHLWLDESLTVEIARRPVGGLLDALRRDGSPPLYYLSLHVWISMFGTGDVAVRALSGILSLITLPVAWIAGRRVGRAAAMFGSGDADTPRRTGLAALLLFACSPYAIRYGSETRMYSLVVLLVLLFGLALVRALERPTRRRLVVLTVATSALVYTHYWTFLLLTTVAVFLAVQALRRVSYRRPALSALAAMLASAVLFAPWMPSFLSQMLHTGTPWAARVQAQVLLDTVFDWAGPTSTGALLGVVLLAAALLGLTGRPQDDGLHIVPTGRVPGRYLVAVWLIPLALAYLVNTTGGSAYTERYTGISLPAFLLLAALGIGLLPGRARATLLVIVCVTGLFGGWHMARQERTQAGEIASRIAALARPGDVVAYCPDQLGPAVYRAIERRGDLDVRQIVYADTSGPALVDWVDYAERMRRASGADFAARVNTMAGPGHAVFLVRADGYKTLEGACAVVSDQLAALRDRTFQVDRRMVYEGASLERFSTLR
ncbi:MULTISPECIES: glycosyltransferase family 39 protein [Protofrankia]|uniref:Membrane protein-like protein n=1 Tax=Candidatus Protofrankia datiscae TaxID=2716812 RepID=F8AZR0_9ACTN|nr:MULTISPECIES: glycosyltransferase family 39 protein [Protofrankia]AEH09667.1 membrane protein-like protein [Candidatus Protofrankia datiscae]